MTLSAIIALSCMHARAAEEYRLLRLEGNLVKWGQADLGTPSTISYAFLSERTRFPDARNCRELVPIDALLSRSGITRSRFIEEVEAAFASWEEVAGVKFRRTGDPATADIRIGAQADPRRWAFADVSYTTAAGAASQQIDRALICFNPMRRWTLDFGHEEGVYNLRYVFMHEAGHAIGLDHSISDDQVMSYKYPERWRGPQSGDIHGAVSLYGRPAAEAAAPLPVSPAGLRVHRKD